MEQEAGIKLYDFAKEIVKRQKPIKEDKLERFISKISNTATLCDFLLLICPDLRQYVFMVEPEATESSIIKNELLDILNARGTIVDIDMSKHGKRVWEIWIKDKFDNNVYVYQLCDYTKETVIIGGEDEYYGW